MSGDHSVDPRRYFVTAYFGLLELGRPRPGDTIVVSAASGAVGQLVGQIAKLAGCRAVAIAGSDDKLKWCCEIGFDAAINYKKTADLTAAVKEACPRGVDIFFDNTAGPIHDAVMKNLSIGARVVICGRVALPVSLASLIWRAVHGSTHRHTCQRARISGIRLVAQAQ